MKNIKPVPHLVAGQSTAGPGSFSCFHHQRILPLMVHCGLYKHKNKITKFSMHCKMNKNLCLNRVHWNIVVTVLHQLRNQKFSPALHIQTSAKKPQETSDLWCCYWSGKASRIWKCRGQEKEIWCLKQNQESYLRSVFNNINDNRWFCESSGLFYIVNIIFNMQKNYKMAYKITFIENRNKFQLIYRIRRQRILLKKLPDSRVSPLIRANWR